MNTFWHDYFTAAVPTGPIYYQYNLLVTACSHITREFLQGQVENSRIDLG